MNKVIFLVLIATLSACSSMTGWEFSIGVTPIKSVDNRKSLAQEREYRSQGAVAPTAGKERY